jgi:hypothetical protein
MMLFIYNLLVINVSYLKLFYTISEEFNYENSTFVIVSSLTFVRGSLNP